MHGSTKPPYNSTMFVALILTVIQDPVGLNTFDQSSYMEKKLAEWKPAESYAVPKGTLVTDTDELVGEWHVSTGFDGTTVLMPQTWVNSASGLWLWVWPPKMPPPYGVRMVSGALNSPAER